MTVNPRRNARALRQQFRRFVSLVSIAALITPSVLIVSTGKARASSWSPSIQTAPASAPPDVFNIGANASLPLWFGTINAFLTSQAESLFAESKTNTKVQGPEATFSERIVGAMSSALGFIVPVFGTKREKAPAVPFSQPAAAVDFDFDGDGKSDLGRWHPGTTEFKIHNSNGGSYSTYTIGSSSAQLAPADYDGDGKTDPAFFDCSGTPTWTIRMSSTGSTTTITGFGQAGDIPVSGNYGGTSTDDLALYRPSNGTWYWREADKSAVTSIAWGNAGDFPVPGDYDGDGKLDAAVYRNSDHTWYVLKSSTSYSTWDITAWGNTGDIPVQADFDGDGKTDPTIYRPSDGSWWILKSSTSYATHTSATWGYYGDQPVAGDFDGDGKADLAVWRPTSGYWFVLKSADSSVLIEPLGTLGDTAVPSTYVKQIGGGLTPDQISQAQLSPRNAIGGTNLYSQNFAWGSNLVGLSGRAGLDLGLSISYNSLIWTKVGNAMVFDDTENMTPGFTLDFPKIEPAFYDNVTDRFVYVMVTPSGAREAFRQTTVSNVYETYDSSYGQLTTTGASTPSDPADGISIKVKSTDGTTLDYAWNSGAYRCAKITDRNGNDITVAYDEFGDLQSATDTLGRVITVNHSSRFHPSSITQTWKDTNGSGSNVTHTWASFSYTAKTLATDFGNTTTPLTVIGPPNGTALTVLDKITYADGSSTKFTYNDYGQVWKIENFSAETTPVLLNSVYTNLQSPAAQQLDCPKLTDTYSWVKNFNVISGSEVPTHVTNSPPTTASYSVGGFSGTAAEIDVSMASDPNNSVTKTFVGSSGWNEGLPIATEDWADGASGSERKRWTYTVWTQDHESLAYMNNPRSVESRVGDATNVKRTTTSYYKTVGDTQTSLYGLVSGVKVYDTDLSTVLKEVDYQYNLDSAYTSRRIIGLPSIVETYGREPSGLNLMSKVTYGYDEEDFSHESNQNISSVIEHDNTNYSASFYVGRGNLTTATRYDVTGTLAPQVSKARYDIAGSMVAKLDPLNRKVTIDYTDNFNDTTTTRNTYAYPKFLTDPAENSSTIKYRFDLGANVWAKSPNLNSTTVGKETTRDFDDKGRILRETIVNNGAYTRFEYPPSGVQSKVYSTIIDTNNNNTGDSADEVLTESWTDGAGRTLRARTEHPGSSGGWAGTVAEYDILGRLKRQSVPTEISVPDSNNPNTWAPTGDDDRGSGVWLWTYQKYDWKGRIVRKISTDGIDSPTLNDSDVLISYEGCGCAGRQITTVKGPVTTAIDVWGTLQTTKRRTQKSYEDILGRTYQTEAWDLDGAGSSPYSTVLQKFNGRDQVLESIQYAGGASSSTNQSTTSTYDGFGRLATSHKPEQIDTSNNPTHASYTYNLDDSIQSVTDARGAVESYTYNNLGLVQRIERTMPTGQSAMPAFAEDDDWGDSLTSTTSSPIGYLDSADSTTGIIRGWSLDKDSPNTSNQVHIYIDGPAGQGGTFVGETAANLPRPDVNTTTGFPGDHGYEFQLPQQYADGKPHKIYAHGIDVAGGNGPSLLTNSGRNPILLIPIQQVTEFEYDNLGNRTKMIDQTGNTTYGYDSLSRVQNETKHLRDDWAIPQHDFNIQYTYNLLGGLKSVTDPFGQRIDYGTDRAGRIKSISGTPFSSTDILDTSIVTDYVDNVNYRAWGNVKSIDYSDGTNMSQTFDVKLRTSQFSFGKDGETTSYIKKNYEYYNDDKLKFSGDSGESTMRIDPHRFDRSFVYDQVGRLTAARTAAEARGETTTPDRSVTPYKQDYSFDAFGNVTSRQGYVWTHTVSETNSWVNGRESTWQYDADGRLKHTPGNNYDYDAASVPVVITDPGSFTTRFQQTDGDSQAVRHDVYYMPVILHNRTESTEYWIYSSVLGQVLTEVDNSARKKRTFVYAGKEIIAIQNVTYYSNTALQTVTWEHHDPAEASFMHTVPSAKMYYSAELDPIHSNVGTSLSSSGAFAGDGGDSGNTPNLILPPEQGAGRFGNPYGSFECSIDGGTVPCGFALRFLASGASGGIYNGPAGLPVRYNGQNVLAVFRAYGDGYAGYVPNNAKYIGNGLIQPIGVTSGLPTIGVGGRRVIKDTNLSALNGVTGKSEAYLKQTLELPKIPRGANYTTGQLHALRSAYQEALKRLRNPDCAKLFTEWFLRYAGETDASPALNGTLEYDPAAVMRNVTFRYMELGGVGVNSNGQTSVIGAETINRSEVWLNSQGPFENRQLTVNGNTTSFDFGGKAASLTQAEFGALLLLHELGHAYGEVNGSFLFFGPDSTDATKNGDHTQRIIDACFPELYRPPSWLEKL
ncbi:MAG: FG-GAP-like repeat-containing protein [Acidobacteriota bacterium]